MIDLIGIFGPLLTKLVMVIGAIMAVVGLYFGIKRKGAKEAAAKIQQRMDEIKKEQQAKVDTAVGKDAEVDQLVKEQIEKLTPPEPPQNPVAPTVGDKFKFMWFLPFIFLVGCTWVGVTPQGVVVDIPPRPLLDMCPTTPHPEGTVVEGGVLLTMPDALAIRDYLTNAPPCYEGNILRQEGHIIKLENRLKAVQP